MVWGFYNHNGELLPPRRFSNGKDQEELVDEIIEKFNDSRVVLLRGGVGSGKSAIGITLAGHYGRGIINVPVKPLQDQYQRDYEGNYKVILDGKALKIRLLKGRDNFSCPFSKVPGVTAGFRKLPCTIPLGSSTPRYKVAKECPYWSPVYPKMIDALTKNLDCRVEKYESISGVQHVFSRRKGCEYFDQNMYYKDADVFVYNNAKWHADTTTGKKPKSEIEIFDEADLFLDQLTFRTVISKGTITRFENQIKELKSDMFNEGRYSEALEMESMLSSVSERFEGLIGKGKPLKPTAFDRSTEGFLHDLKEFLSALDTDYSQKQGSNISTVLNYGETVSYYTDHDRVTFFIPKPSLVLKDILEKSSKRILLMSGTLQKSSVLRNVFGLEDFAEVEGEARLMGKMHVKRSGREYSMNYNLWKDPEFRLRYWAILKRILWRAKRPTLVQVHSYQYLPEENIYEGIPTQDEIRDMDQEKEISLFKSGVREILFSTKTDRGIDLPYEKCRSILIMKYPFPSLKDPVFQVMKEKLGERAFWDYYQDIAHRELIQQVGRGLRSKDDWVEVWSPDLKVHQDLKNGSY